MYPWFIHICWILCSLVACQAQQCSESNLIASMPADIRCFDVTSQGQLTNSTVILTFGTTFRTKFEIQWRSLQVDVAERKIYYQDYYQKAFFEVSLDRPDTPIKILDGVQNIVLLTALDWQAKHLYWGDYYGSISVMSIPGGYQRTIISKELKRPTGVAVDPVNGILFWSDSLLQKIERSNLDGSSRTSIISSGLSHPADISLDIPSKHVYYIDQLKHVLCRMNYDGQGLPCIKMSSELFFMTGLAYHSITNTVFLTVHDKNTIWGYNWKAGTMSKLFTPEVKSDKFRSQLKIFDGAVQPNGSNPCAPTRNPCSHFCFKVNENSFNCSCPLGMLLQENGTTCVKGNEHYSIIFADAWLGSVYHMTQYQQEAGLQMKVPYSSITAHPSAIHFDTTSDTIYFSDLATSQIFCMTIMGENKKALLSNVYSLGLRFDHISKLLFWTDSKVKEVAVARADGSGKIVLTSGDFVGPWDIEIHQEMGLLFVTDVGPPSKIERMNMDGSNRKVIAGNSKYSAVEWPYGLTVDRTENVLYYVDGKLNKLMAYDILSATTKEMLSSTPSNTMHNPFGLAIYKENLYWTSWTNATVAKVNKRYGNKASTTQWGLINPRSIHLFERVITSEYKMLYRFYYGGQKCREKCDSNLLSKIALLPCPGGYHSSKIHIGCSKCIDQNHSMPGRRCPCDDNWASCVHRIEEESTCTSDKPYLHFSVQECVQVLFTPGDATWKPTPRSWATPGNSWNDSPSTETAGGTLSAAYATGGAMGIMQNPGYCEQKAIISCTKASVHCEADQDCSINQKCCNSSCGKICTKAREFPASVHPCRGEYQTCDICVSMPHGAHKCLCPPGKALDTDGITCSPLGGECQKSNFCKNGGNCWISYSGANCRCTEGYIGERCDRRSLCYDMKPCQNNGNCTDLENNYQCQCSNFAKGKNCTEPVRCSNTPCSDNRTCYFTPNGTKECRCELGHMGKNCSLWAACQPSPCQNGGNCVRGQGLSYSCTCPSYHTGEMCETYECHLNNPCLNNGECLSSGSERCKCPKSFSGAYCQKLICVPELCENNGRCRNSQDEQCTCPKYYLGRFCRLNVEGKVIKLKLKHSQNVIISNTELRSALSSSFNFYFESKYCLKDKLRKRREAANDSATFSMNNFVLMPGYDEVGQKLFQEIEFVVINSTNQTHVGDKQIFDPSTVKEILSCTNPKLEKELGAQVFIDSETPLKVSSSPPNNNLRDIILVACALVVIAIVTGVILFFYRRRRASRKSAETEESNAVRRGGRELDLQEIYHPTSMSRRTEPFSINSSYVNAIYEDLDDIKLHQSPVNMASNYYNSAPLGPPPLPLPPPPYTKNYQDLIELQVDLSNADYQSLRKKGLGTAENNYEING